MESTCQSCPGKCPYRWCMGREGGDLRWSCGLTCQQMDQSLVMFLSLLSNYLECKGGERSTCRGLLSIWRDLCKSCKMGDS